MSNVRPGRIEILEALVDDRHARKLRRVSARDSGQIRPRLDAHDPASAPRQRPRRQPRSAADLQYLRLVGRHFGERKKIVEELLGIAATRPVVKLRDFVEGLSPQSPSFLIHGKSTASTTQCQRVSSQATVYANLNLRATNC
jgi:hypothetical protein